MTYELIPLEGEPDREAETSEFRRTHYRVYDVDGFAGSFATTSPVSATLATVWAHIREKYDRRSPEGYGSKDLVVMLGDRIVAVVLKGLEGEPKITSFENGEAMSTTLGTENDQESNSNSGA